MRHSLRMRPLIVLGALVALAVVTTLAAPPAIEAGGIAVVTKTADTNDGLCNADCSLREAIGAANVNGIDTITVPAGSYTLTIPGAGENANATGDLDILDDLTINGAGQATTIIDGDGIDRVFHIHSGDVTFNDLTITGGSAPDLGSDDDGGGIFNDGSSSDSVTINRCAVTGNTAVVGDGGGIANKGDDVTLSDSTVSGNTAGNDGGGLDNNGGDDVTITNSTFSNNTAADDGGGLDNNGDEVTIVNSTFSNNTAAADGGGLFSDSPTTITDSTISNNHTLGGPVPDGGGIFQLGSTLMVSNTTITGNSASGSVSSDGGGIAIRGGAVATIMGSTISGNTTQAGGGGINSNDTMLTLTDTTIANNMAGRDGGGIELESDAVLIATRVALTGNSAGADGGGVAQTASSSTATISDSTISGNAAVLDGGGLFNSGTAIINESTISGNGVGGLGGAALAAAELSVATSLVSEGGGIYNSSTLNATNVTISGNAAQMGGGVFHTGSSSNTYAHLTVTANSTITGGAGLHGGSPGVFQINNTIVANQSAGPDCGGTPPITNDNNLDGDGSCLPAPDTNDLPNTDPLLGPLADNGGLTHTHALLPGSPAINAGSSGETLDQRGAPRPGTADNDIGAYERNHVDLAITKSDGQTKVLPGQALGYAIVVSNAGPDPAIDAVVTDTSLAPLIAGGWTCVTGGGGGVCDDPGPTAGNIATTVDLPVGGSVIFSATATVATPSAGLAPNTATVAVADPAITTDLDPTNNSATDVDSIPAPVAVLPGDEEEPVKIPLPPCDLLNLPQGSTGPEGGTVVGAGGCVSVEAGVGSVGGEVDITVVTRPAGGDQPPTPGSILVGGVIVEITATDVGTGKPVTEFDPPLTVCVTIDPLIIAAEGLSAEELALASWDAKTMTWVPGANQTFDAATGESCADFGHLSDFAVLGTVSGEEEEAEAVVKEEEEEPAPAATLALVAGGQFVQWSFGEGSAAAVFGSLKIAWLFNRDAVNWTSFVPQLCISDFALVDGAVLWLVAFADGELF